MKNKIPVLKGPKHKKVKTAEACQGLCTSCIIWNYKTNKKAAKRLCYLLSVSFAVSKVFVCTKYN